jgi:hypothetical protein
VSLDYINDFKVDRELELGSPKQLLQVPLVKTTFPFSRQYSNLEPFKDENQEIFEQFKAELEQKFGHIERANDLQVAQSCKDKELEQNFINEHLQFIKIQNRHSEKVLNAQDPNKTYQILDSSTTIMGTVGREIKLPDGRSMVEIIKDLGESRIYLVEHDRKLIKERDCYVELKTDNRGVMVDLKDTKTMLKEIEMHKREPNANLEKLQRELERDRERDLSRGLEM